MPMYEFECADCGHRTEVLMSRKAPAPACEQCGSANVARLLSAFRVGKASCSGAGLCERWPSGERPSECPPGRCCGIGD